MKFNVNLIFRILMFTIIILLNSKLFAQDLIQPIIEDSIDVHKTKVHTPYRDIRQKDIFGNPISEKEVEEFNDKDTEEQREEVESFVGGYVFMAGALIFASPIYLPLKLLDDDYSDQFYYQKYPFENEDGFTEYDGKKWMLNFTLSSQYVDKNTIGYKFNSSFRLLRFSIDPTYSYYNIDNEDNYISNFDTTIKITFAQSHFINFRTGLGYSHFETDSKFDGINWIYEIGIFQKPFNLNLGYNLTGYDLVSEEEVKFNNDFNINFGYFFKRFELKLGYRFLKIGEEKLCGPEFSSSLWF